MAIDRDPSPRQPGPRAAADAPNAPAPTDVRAASDAPDDARELVTLVRPEAPGRPSRAPSSFPADLYEQARGRLRLLAAFFFVAFTFDVLIYVTVASLVEGVPRDDVRTRGFQWINVGAALMSAIVWWSTRSTRKTAIKVHWIGLVYEVIVCFVAGYLMYWQFYLNYGVVPQLTWVPAIVIMFPLIMPGPPRRMLATAIVAGMMAPLSLFVLDITGKIGNGAGEQYVPSVIASVFAIAFAYLGARVIYGMGREIAKARAMGSYQLEERLGEGGMGEVWRAKHRLLARTAAIKLIRPALSGNVGISNQARHRFEREAQAIASLRSPHTVDLFDFGIADDGAFYYAMELLDGMDADALVRKFGPMPAERVVFVLRQACHSLSEAESRGLIHRDIKPSNIFLCRYGEDHDFVKVLDFGIVKSANDAPQAATALTGENVIHGTPAFMAPEQALGQSDIDTRADIYSLGCVAYWLLTGHLVFTADTPTGMLMHHIQAAPSAPSSRSEMDVPPAMDRIVLACLAKNPADRPQSARELSRMLDEVGIEGAWTDARRREWWEKHRPA